MIDFKKMIFLRQNIVATLLLCFSYLALLILGACIDNVDSNPFGECSNTAVKANIKEFEVLYQPYLNERYSTASDQVNFKDFKINLRFSFDLLSQNSFSSSLPGTAYALSCIALYDVRNISNISIILAAPYEGIATGTDISYLFLAQDNLRLSEFRDFSKIPNFMSLTLQKAPSAKTQLKTKIIIFLKNGSQILIESTSPTLLIN